MIGVMMMLRFLKFIWCLPQQLVALMLKLFVKTEASYHIHEKGIVVHYTHMKCGSVSLGNQIFLCESSWDDEDIILHEYGHYRQSLILGWFYLLVIGLPSIIWNSCFRGYRKKHKVSYYWFYTEAWANKLGGVDL